MKNSFQTYPSYTLWHHSTLFYKALASSVCSLFSNGVKCIMLPSITVVMYRVAHLSSRQFKALQYDVALPSIYRLCELDCCLMQAGYEAAEGCFIMKGDRHMKASLCTPFVLHSS